MFHKFYLLGSPVLAFAFSIATIYATYLGKKYIFNYDIPGKNDGADSSSQIPGEIKVVTSPYF